MIIPSKQFPRDLIFISEIPYFRILYMNFPSKNSGEGTPPEFLINPIKRDLIAFLKIDLQGSSSFNWVGYDECLDPVISRRGRLR